MQRHWLPDADDTIVALSTPWGRSGIGVVRVSGSRTRAILEGCFRSREPFQDRLARYGRLERPDGGLVDRVLVTVFQAPRSYTGEDVAEISAHGNPLILKEIEGLLASWGARRAAPGEFTLRAVAHGKMDLAQAEAVRDFIEAQTETQAQAARLQMDGALARHLGPHKEALIRVIAELEAGIDFAEDDVGLPDSGVLAGQVSDMAAALERDAESFQYGRLLFEGLYVAIVGTPNVGKSSLFNRIVCRERAIVTELPGTTRDVLTETVEIGGVPIRFADTAGVRAAAGDAIEAMGVDRTLETLGEADMALMVLDGSRELNAEDRALLDRVGQRPHIVVINKRDLPQRWEALAGEHAVRVSAWTGDGLDELEARIEDFVGRRRPDVAGFLVTSRRQREVLVAGMEQLRAAASALERSVPQEMVLVDLYGALSWLGELTGEVVSDDILDRVFSTFCIGK